MGGFGALAQTEGVVPGYISASNPNGGPHQGRASGEGIHHFALSGRIFLGTNGAQYYALVGMYVTKALHMQLPGNDTLQFIF